MYYSAHMKQYPVSIAQQLGFVTATEPPQEQLPIKPSATTAKLLKAMAANIDELQEPAQIAERFGVADVRGFLYHAVKLGLVEQVPVPNIKRRFRYKLSAAGELAVRQLLRYDSKNKAQAK